MSDVVSVGVNTDNPEPVKFRELDEYVQATYSPPSRNNSVICDIMAAYLMGQKILYTESKTYCEQKLNALMFPAILITAVCTILSLVLKDYSYGPTLVSSLSGFNSFLLAIINYLKLDAKAESHRISSYKFDKLRSEIVFNSGKILLIDQTETPTSLVDVLTKIETNVKEIKETNQFVIPEAVRYNFQKLYTLNIFSEVKRIQTKEMLCINELKSVLDNLRKLEVQTDPDEELTCLYEKKRKLLLDQFIAIQTEYFDLDDGFEKELSEYIKRSQKRFDPCGWMKS